MDQDALLGPDQPPRPPTDAMALADVDVLPGGPTPPGRSTPGGSWWPVAWLVIIAICGFMFIWNLLPEREEDREDTAHLALTIMEIQAKYILGAPEILPVDRRMLLSQSEEMLNMGSPAQRQAFLILAAELGGVEEAQSVLALLRDDLDQAINDSSRAEPFCLTETEQQVQEVLEKIYLQAEISEDDPEGRQSLVEAIESLTPGERALLEDELGWFGRLALHPEGTPDADERAAVLASAARVAVLLLGAAALGLLAGVAGLVGLITLLVLVLMGSVRSGLSAGRGHHGVYAETFAVWLVVFFALQQVVGLLRKPAPHLVMPLLAVSFFVSLVALAWPMLRGARWGDVRRDIGWTLDRMPGLEPVFGIGGYLMALPMLAVGVVLTLGLMAIQQGFSEPAPMFDPAGSPAHPIIGELAGPNWLVKAQILFLAAVAAPVVEETMFRGVLYRHLRDASASWGVALSVLFSATLNAFIFAAIHPQGWVAIPALMALAYAFLLLREWRGSVVPAIITHGISNGLVMCLVIALLGD